MKGRARSRWLRDVERLRRRAQAARAGYERAAEDVFEKGVAYVSPLGTLSRSHGEHAEVYLKHYARRAAISGFPEVRVGVREDILVAVDAEGQVVGVISLGVFDGAIVDEERGDLPGDVLVLTNLCVTPEHQHRGLGRRLALAAMAAKAMWGADDVWLHAEAKVEGFWRKLGFERGPQQTMFRQAQL